MTHEELDRLWFQAMEESIKDNEMVARYHFAALVAAALKETVPSDCTDSHQPVAWMVYTLDGKSVCVTDNPVDFTDEHKVLPLYTAPPQPPLTIERLRDALVASRIIPPAAVEDPDEYDDGVTLFRIEALHRRIT